jgi:nucleotide-binding universal stress UspA family protein
MDGSLSEEYRSTAIFQRLLVPLDLSTPSKGILGQALDLARRLEIPVHGIFGPAGAPEERHHPALPAGPLSQPRHQSPSQGADVSTTIEEIAQDYAAACARVNVAWQQSFWDGRSAADLCELAKPTDVLTLGPALRPDLKKALLRATLRPGFPPLLACSPTAARVSRVLVVDRVDGPEGRSFLAEAITLCHRLQAQPIVLTVARSEWGARARQHAGRDAAAAYGLDADFDFLVGADLRTAVTRVAQWRRCSLVVMGRNGRAPWLRWWRAPAARLVDFADSFSLLTLPGTGVAGYFSPRATPGLLPGSLTTQGLLPLARCGGRSAEDRHERAGTGA